MRSDNMEKMTQATGEFIELVIAEAKKSFQPGREQIKTDLKTVINSKILPAAYKDKRFLLNAHWLHDTNFIAARGPHSETEMTDFITDTVYNQTHPIRQVIALGHCLAYSEHTYQDFHDYIIKEREAIFGQYHVSIKRLSGNATTTESAHQIFPHGIISSQLLIKPVNKAQASEEQLNVTLIELRDNQALDLRQQHQVPLKKTLWLHFMQSLKTPIMVHCAAGLGRTGHLILMLEILKYYEQIFENNNPGSASAKIHYILQEMRASRPGLVLTEQQFECAIRNANILHSFALENENTLNAQEVPSSIPLSFFSRKAAPKQPAEQQNNVLKLSKAPQ